METSLLNEFVVDRLESIEQNLCGYAKDKEPEALHRLRVDIKKVNAVFSFAKKIYKEKYRVPKLKPVFEAAGKIRETQINIELLKLVPHPPETIISRLKTKETILVQQFIKNSSRYTILVQDFREKFCLPEKLPPAKTILKYFKKQKGKANKILQHHNRKCMHRYRKKIKKLMYVYSALPTVLQNKIELDEVRINKVQNRLGDWHDTYSAVSFISHKHAHAQTSEFLAKLKEKEKSQFETLVMNMTKKRK